jgi:molecular chaperone DnaK (HSP70)
VGYSLGVDLGTTFVAAAIASATSVEMFTLGDRSVVTPATVYLREDGTLVTGEAAGLRAVSSPDRVSREFKRRLGNPTPVMLGGQPHTVTALLGTLLRDVVQKVIETEGGPPDRIVLTHPANWGPFRRALFEEVPQHAGLDNPSMVTEPEAAAAHYAASRLLVDGQTVAVYDLGGGTFDATVLRKLPTGVEILGTPEGVERLGGVDFDEAILSHVDYAADGALSELDMRDPQNIVALARLRQDCILAKEALSVDTETVLPVLLPGRHFDVRITLGLRGHGTSPDRVHHRSTLADPSVSSGATHRPQRGAAGRRILAHPVSRTDGGSRAGTPHGSGHPSQIRCRPRCRHTGR